MSFSTLHPRSRLGETVHRRWQRGRGILARVRPGALAGAVGPTSRMCSSGAHAAQVGFGKSRCMIVYRHGQDLLRPFLADDVGVRNF